MQRKEKGRRNKGEIRGIGKDTPCEEKKVGDNVLLN